MSTIIVRYNFGESGPPRYLELNELVKRTYGGAITYLSNDTFIIETIDNAHEVFAMLSHLFTYDDKLFVGKLEEFVSLHQLPKVKASIHKIAV